jgi:3-methyladenine DNA glycosylase AlkD
VVTERLTPSTVHHMPADLLRDLAVAFSAHGDAERAAAMRAYMRHQFPFYGIAAHTQGAIARAVLAERGLPPDEAAVKRSALDCWERPEREWQYFACGLVGRRVRILSPRFLPTARKLITTKSWWDTVDALASRAVGPLVRMHPTLVATMDRWIDDKDIWLARTAILHQLSYKDATDTQRLFDYCLRRGGSSEFFIRKAIGWALRQYSKTDARAVRTFVRRHATELSGLSKREALKWLERSATR